MQKLNTRLPGIHA